MYFDGASRTIPREGLVARVRIVFFSPQNHVIPRVFSLTEPCTNNVAEYNALLIGLQLAHQLGVRNLQAYGDSELIVNQLRGDMRSEVMTSSPISTPHYKWRSNSKASI